MRAAHEFKHLKTISYDRIVGEDKNMPISRKKKISPLDPIKVEVTIAPSTRFSFDLLDKRNLKKIGISRSHIREVDPIFAIPGYLYEEEGVAGKHHRLLGSACACFTLYDDRRYSIDDIWYFDENTKKNHFGGREHWNHERRIIEHSNQGPKILDITNHVEGHAITASPYIDISLDPGPRGRKVKKRVFRP